MNPELDQEILEIMERRGMSYDEAFEHFQRKQKQLELAVDRQKANKIKSAITRQKQKRFRDSNQAGA